MNKPAPSLASRPLRRSQPTALCRWLPAAGVLAGGLLVACTPEPDPYFIDRDAAVGEGRVLRVVHSPHPVKEEPPPMDVENSDEEAGIGQRHKGEEGKMGKPTSKSKSGLYAMKGPRDAVPYSVGGLGLVGTGRGGGGTGGGTIGLGCWPCGGARGHKDRRAPGKPWGGGLCLPSPTGSWTPHWR